MSKADHWAWFCGTNSSDLNSLKDHFTWNTHNIVTNFCALDGLYSGLQIIFLTLFTTVLLALKFCTRYRNINTPYLIRYPGHFVRWFLSVVLILLLLSSIGEGVLTSGIFTSAYQPNGLPHLYITPILGLLCIGISLVFNNCMELWRQSKLSWLMLLYWLASVAIEAGQLVGLMRKDMVDVGIIRFDVIVGRLVILILLALIEMNVLRIKVLHWCTNHNTEEFPSDLKSSDMHFYDKYTSALSAGTFYWLRRLLVMGAKRPLNIEDLGTLQRKFRARACFEEFRESYVKEKELAAYQGRTPSLWRVFGKVSGPSLFLAISVRTVADMLAFVGPVAISGITNYAINGSIQQEDEGQHFVTVSEFFSNGYILVLVIFVSFSLRGLLNANSVFLQVVQGTKVKTAMHAMVYEKSLRLSMFLTTSGTMTMGQISNHMAVDSTQPFWFAVMGFFIFTTPINVIVTLILLYITMGPSALIGSLVLVLIFPFQVRIAKAIITYNKDMLKLSDQRLKQSNELLQGIKLLKLYGWEQLYELSIEAIRRKELKCLGKVLMSLSITIALTGVAPVFITLVAFGIYPTFSGIPLKPDVTFSSLALFNRLYVPLFTLPMTISHLVNTMVSFQRLTTFFIASEVEEKDETRNWHEVDIDEDEEDEEENVAEDKAFGIYPTFSGIPLKPDVAFSSLALFNQLLVPLFTLPMTISHLVNTMVSFKRLTAFFIASEVEEEEETRNWHEVDIDEDEEEENVAEDKFHHNSGFQNGNGYTLLFNGSSNGKIANSTTGLLPRTTTPSNHTYGAMETNGLTASLKQNGVPMSRALSPLPQPIAIQVDNGTFTWDKDNISSDPILYNIDVQIPTGKLTMIVGQVGTGKSSLLSALLGEMVTLSGTVQFNSEHCRVAYAAQKAWLCNASLKENILFGQTMDETRYKQVIEACALGPDIDILPAGDRTEIGEKGINLSGGQKQRVSVARAMYAARDIVILDDPLSALDVHVGSHLFQEGIMGILLKEKQTVVLVTHQIQYMQSADQILVLKDGSITNSGTFDEVCKIDPELNQSWRHALHLASESEAEMSGNESQSEVERDELRKKIKKQVSIGKDTHTEKFDMTSTKGKLIEDEEIERGSVSYQVYFYYIRNVGWRVMTFLLIFIILNIGFTVYNGFWLSDWSEAGLIDANVSTSYYIKGYAGLQCALLVFVIGTLCSSVYACYLAAKHLHFGMLRNIIRVPTRFFDTTPIGRVLNRMSSDTQLIDMRIATTLYILLNGVVLTISAGIVNTIITPWFIVLAFPIVLVYLAMQTFYLRSSRELQRLDSVTKSPVFAFFSETLTGLETIRAYKEQSRFFKVFLERVDTNLIPFLYLRTAMAWLTVRLDFVGAFIILLSGGSALIGASFTNVSPSLVGLSLTFALSVAGYLNYLVRTASDVEIMMNAVERVKHYTTIENEDYNGMMPPHAWPQLGEISLEGISARYARQLDPVLKKVTVYIKPGEKVGICGRTGSGKSSLTLSLFRIIDMFEGHIVIDGVDISSIPLMTLRQRLSIIPQDPVLFTGTIRQNLDPEGQRSDDDLWEAVEIAQLKDTVQALPEGLEFMVTEGGENFSMGQRQLFCLGRAFLRKSRILVMDEATASIDMKTDKILQKVVATAFADRTVLTIAHRVTTILNCDTILVLDAGEIVEHDSPDNLLAREDSIFANFVKSKK